jgi:multidrug resistance efflux pump
MEKTLENEQKKKRPKAKLILLIVVVLIVAGGAGALLYVNYTDTHFYSTENAQVMSDMISVYPLLTGKLTEWDIQEGDAVKTGQIMGRQDTGTLVSSSAVNSAALQNSADSIASKADIVSPIDGVVIQSTVVKGEMVAPASSIATIADLSHMYITANIEETNILKIKEGQAVDIKIDMYPGRDFTGYVEKIGKAANSIFNPFSNLTTSGTFSKTTQLLPVKISIAGAEDLNLSPGVNATVKIHIQ